MWIRTRIQVGGSKRFFYLSFGSDGLSGYYKLNFSLWHYHKVKVTDFDDVIPWEKDLYISMLAQKVEEDNEKMKIRQAEARVARKLGKA